MSLAKDLKLGLNSVDVNRLLFDQENPRLPPETSGYSQSDLLRYLENAFDLPPVAQSMADRGYFEEEPLVGIPGPNDNVIVVEGNRRLACLKLLTDVTARGLSRKSAFWDKLAAESEIKGTQNKLLKVPVVIHDSRDNVRAILGFRHITSTKRWDAFSKGRFINHLIETDQTEDFESVAREVGSRSTSIRNVYIAYRVLVQATDAFNLDTSKVTSEFGIFYTALTDPNIKSYLGIDSTKELPHLKNPVSKNKIDELTTLIELLHGTQKILPVITDSRQIKRLGEILVSPTARKVIQSTRNFSYAYSLTSGEKSALVTNLEKADIFLTEAYKTAYRYDKDPTVKSLIRKCSETIMRMAAGTGTRQEQLKTE